MSSPFESLSLSKRGLVKIDEATLAQYGKDWTTYYNIKASAVLFPETTEDVVEIVKWARKNKIRLVPSGGRTGLSGAACALQGEVVVSFEKMNKILHFNPVDQTVLCQAGVITQELQKFAEQKGLYYPVDFAARGSSQLGGNVATNAGGIKVIRYGMTRDWVAGLTAVTGSGETLHCNQGLTKNATGYDFRHLFIGSEGTLGFVTEILMKLTTKPKDTRVLLLSLPSHQKIMEVFAEFRRHSHLTAFEMLSDKALQKVIDHAHLDFPLGERGPFYVVLEAEILGADSEDQLLAAFETCQQKGLIADGTIAQSAQQAQLLWRFREDISESLAKFSPYKNDLSVTVSNCTTFMVDLDQTLQKHYPSWEVIWFGHIGDGNLHINILRPSDMTKEAFVQECRKVDELVFAQVQKYKGSISAEHGVGLSKKSFLKYARSSEEIRLMKDVKKIFDPDGILNPGKIFD